jgi:hypothetical protein
LRNISIDEIPFDFESPLDRVLVPMDFPWPPAVTNLRNSEDQQRRARIHRKFDLMKQTQDHDGEVRTAGGRLKSSRAA